MKHIYRIVGFGALLMAFLWLIVYRNNMAVDNRIHAIDDLIAANMSRIAACQHSIDALPIDYDWVLYTKMVNFWNGSGRKEQIEVTDPDLLAQLNAADSASFTPDVPKYDRVDYKTFLSLLLNDAIYRKFLPVSDKYGHEIDNSLIQKGQGYYAQTIAEKEQLAIEISNLQNENTNLRDKKYDDDTKKWDLLIPAKGGGIFAGLYIAIYILANIRKVRIKKAFLINCAIVFLLMVVFMHILLVTNKTYNGMSRELFGKPDSSTTIQYFGVFPTWTINLLYVVYFVYSVVLVMYVKKNKFSNNGT